MRPDLSVNGQNEALDEPYEEQLDGDFGATEPEAAPRIRGAIHGSAYGEIEAILAQHAPEPPRPAQAATQDLGPCLYFGPAGERCDRRTVHDGFCSRHQPGAKAVAASSTDAKKVVAAAIAIIGILLPYLIDVLRELTRFLPH
jgi:hypothetical protein